jgi:hypothetical protein
MSQTVELLWFSDCANHPAVRAMLEEVIAEVAPGTPIRDIDATDPATAASARFPGSPTDPCERPRRRPRLPRPGRL